LQVNPRDGGFCAVGAIADGAGRPVRAPHD
jgi:hypothetical protein